MIPLLKMFDTPELLAKSVAQELLTFLAARMDSDINTSIVLSGGSTPKLLFRELVKSENQRRISWEKILVFWGDERCVAPDHPESNYGMTKQNLLNFIPVPKNNIIRMRGEDAPETGVENYTDEIRQHLNLKKGEMPVFDWIFLGMGTDGHTASLFPGSPGLAVNNKICISTKHPVTGQNRLTLTLPALNNAHRVSFLITGTDKSKVSAEIYHRKSNFELYPAAQIQPSRGNFEWFIDKAVASAINPPIQK
jgi:6-phosphogluconolactonase